jgi:excisionase family DNA binding protein
MARKYGPGLFLTVEEVAERYGVSKRTVQRWLQRGWLKGYQGFRRTWLRAEELDDHLVSSPTQA